MPTTYGPNDATLTVHTKRAGVAGAAGHDLTLLVARWHATVDDDGAVTFEADGSSLRVLEGTGGIGTLGDDDKWAIEQRIDEEVLRGRPITYRDGQLTLNGVSRPLEISFDGREGQARVKQSDFGIKPYSALFGTLKVADVVDVRVRKT
ncbi:YceI-like domain-containing protein [Solirubrobacter pauli]|uniref:YceI-like domain-containing protein n=1 Tax=Solirubrobacter pauli TaxID=166793 RepID=A0A660L8L4_9ACTN|nr:YceI family protein [Solirubrobacter pauli]RKQ90280.1 YceI-like domain-containing protein [Solirubrobacter pauli]